MVAEGVHVLRGGQILALVAWVLACVTTGVYQFINISMSVSYLLCKHLLIYA